MFFQELRHSHYREDKITNILILDNSSNIIRKLSILHYITYISRFQLAYYFFADIVVYSITFCVVFTYNLFFGVIYKTLVGMGVNFLYDNFWKRVFFKQLWYYMSDAKAAINCINLFNLYVTVLGKIIYCIGKALGGPSLSFWPR